MFEMASKKLGLDHAVLSNLDKNSEFEPGKKVGGKAMEKEIDSLLKYGAYDLFRGFFFFFQVLLKFSLNHHQQQTDEREGGQEETNLMRDQDIDKILERTSRVIQYGKEGPLLLYNKTIPIFPSPPSQQEKKKEKECSETQPSLKLSFNQQLVVEWTSTTLNFGEKFCLTNVPPRVC